jgi:hypothetical protein
MGALAVFQTVLWWFGWNKHREEKMLNLRISVNVSQSNYGSGGLHLQEEIEIAEADFVEMAKILGQFHDLAEKIKRERAKG